MSDEFLPTGDCYEAAFRFLNQLGEESSEHYVLVHGNVATLNQDEVTNHAWVEEGGIVHEVSRGRHLTFQKEDYYKRFGIRYTRRYTLLEALVASVKSSHSGPWD